MENTLMKVGACVVLLIGSYVASALFNASPVTQPPLGGPRSRGLILASPAPPQKTDLPADTAESPSDAKPAIGQALLHRL